MEVTNVLANLLLLLVNLRRIPKQPEKNRECLIQTIRILLFFKIKYEHLQQLQL